MHSNSCLAFTHITKFQVHMYIFSNTKNVFMIGSLQNQHVCFPLETKKRLAFPLLTILKNKNKPYYYRVHTNFYFIFPEFFLNLRYFHKLFSQVQMKKVFLWSLEGFLTSKMYLMNFFEPKFLKRKTKFILTTKLLYQ